MSKWGNASPRFSASDQDGQGNGQGPRSALGEVLYGFRLQGRVIHALLLREMTTRFGRDQVGFLWIFFEPLVLALAIGLVKYLIVQTSNHGVPPFLFGVIGYAPFFAFRSIINQASSAVSANMTLLYHRQVKLLDVMLARSLLQTAVVSVVLLLVIGGAIWIVDMIPHSTPLLVGGLLLMILFSHGIAMLVAAASATFEMTDRIVAPLTYLALPFSGAFISMHTLPPSWREVMLWNPQVHFHEMMRDGMFGDLIPAYYDIGYMMVWIIPLNFLGILALRAARPKLEY